ncbi:MAG TPA: VWA domain-containing protein [Vicinamibacterales bacterium]|nr:VWA domain-containing protein [Vicinamibacterales bacterium]
MSVLTVAARPLAQSPQPQPVFRSNVELVEVDVVVRDEQGRPVRGLTKDDFRILEKQTPQPVATFVEVSRDYPSPAITPANATVVEDVADNQSPQNERLLVVIVDDMTPRALQEPAKRLATQVVNRLGHDASMALLLTSGTASVELTRDPARLRAAIDKIATKASKAPRVPERQGGDVSQPSMGEIYTMDPSGCHWSTLERAARMIAPEDVRRKAFVLISPSCALHVRIVNGVPITDSGQIYVAALDAVEAMRRAKVALYALDPRGERDFRLSDFPSVDLTSRSDGGMTTSDPAGRTANMLLDPQSQRDFIAASYLKMDSPITLSQQMLRMFSEETSGFAVTNTNDFDGGMNKLVDDFDHYYLLGFYPTDSSRTGYRPIEVTVNRPGVTLRYRRGFELGRRAAPPKNKDPLVAESTGVLPKTDLPLRLFAAAIPDAASRSRELVALEVRAPREAFATSQRDDLSVTVLAIDLQRSKVIRNLKVERTIDVTSTLARTTDPTIAYTATTSVDLVPGTYQLRVSAKSARVQKSGSVYLTVDVPAPAGASWALGGIVLGYAGGPAAALPSTSPSTGTTVVPFEPTLDRSFTPADRLRVFVSLARKGAHTVTGKIDLLDSAGTIVHTMDMPSVPASAAGLDVTLSLAGLAPGTYTVRVTGADGKVTLERSAGITIR